MQQYENCLLPREEADNDGYVWYFGYGSNMNDNTFIKRRKIKSIKSIAAKVKDWQLTFDLRSNPFGEQCFGNIQPIKGCELHGVAHKITIEDYWNVQRTEGGGGYWLGYQSTRLLCETYEGETIVAWGLQNHKDMDTSSRYPYLPSLRYLRIIREGARNYRLEEDYIKYLDSIETCRDKNALAYIIRILITIIFLPAFVFLIFYIILFLTKMIGRRTTIFFWRFILYPYQRFSWWVYGLLPESLAYYNKGVDCKLKLYMKDKNDLQTKNNIKNVDNTQVQFIKQKND